MSGYQVLSQAEGPVGMNGTLGGWRRSPMPMSMEEMRKRSRRGGRSRRDRSRRDGGADRKRSRRDRSRRRR